MAIREDKIVLQVLTEYEIDAIKAEKERSDNRRRLVKVLKQALELQDKIPWYQFWRRWPLQKLINQTLFTLILNEIAL